MHLLPLLCHSTLQAFHLDLLQSIYLKSGVELNIISRNVITATKAMLNAGLLENSEEQRRPSVKEICQAGYLANVDAA